MEKIVWILICSFAFATIFVVTVWCSLKYLIRYGLKNLVTKEVQRMMTNKN